MEEKDMDEFYQEAEKGGFLKWRAASTSTSPVLDIFSVNIAHIESNSLSIPILIKCAEENKTVETLGLIDSGAGGEIYRSKLHENPWPRNQTSKKTNHRSKRRWNQTNEEKLPTTLI